MENTLTVAELKRRGAAAIEDGLKRGPIHVVKRNKSAGVVLSEAHDQRLLAQSGKSIPGMTAVEWPLAYPSRGTLSKRQIDRRLRHERDW